MHLLLHIYDDGFRAHDRAREHNLGRGINERNLGGEDGGRREEAEAHVTPLSVLSADPSPLEYSYSRLDGIPPVETDLFREVGGNLWLLKWIKDSRGLRGEIRSPRFIDPVEVDDFNDTRF